MKILSRIKDILLEPRFFFLLIAFILVQLWFSKNLLFGGTEVAIPTYTPEKILNQIKWIWWEALGPGVSIPTASVSIPFYAFMALLEHFGFGAILIQKIVFFILIYLQGLGASLVFKIIISKESKRSILAGLFYIFNPFMMIQVWHRFMYTNFILSAALPLLVYFYLQLLERRQYRYIFYFLVTSFVSSYMYSAIAPAMAVWLAVLPIYITAIVINRSNIRKLYSVTFLSLLLFIFWLATNLWWIYPLSQNQGIFKFFSTQSNSQVLVTLSEQSTISNVVRGLNPYNLFLEKDWGEIYQNSFFQFLSWIPFILFIFGLIKSKELIKRWFMIILFIFGVFIAKGAAEPFGFINSWLYSHFFILGAIKNPFEKLGSLVFLPISVFAAVGISFLWNQYKKNYQRALVLIAVFGCAIYVWPMLSDKLFGSNKYPPFFNSPADYLESSNILSKELNKDEGKILHLPIGEGDSTTYLWSNIYNGADLANHLFPGISISKFSYIPFVDSILTETAKVFHSDNYQLYNQAISNLGVKYIVLHKDIDWYFRNFDNPKFIEAKLDKFKNLIILKDLEHLKIYKYTGKVGDEVSIPKKIASYSVAGKTNSSNLDFMWEGSGVGEKAYLETTENNTTLDPVNQKILLPRRLIIDSAEFRNGQEFIPPTYYEKYLPGSFFYPFISIIEKIQTTLTPSYNKPVRVLLLTTKRLREVQRFREQNKEDLFNNSIRAYSIYLNEALNLFYDLKDEKINDERFYLSKYILKQERKDLENLLEYPKDESTKTLIKNNLKKIDEFNKHEGFALMYPVDNTQEFINKDSYSYQFSIKDEFKGNPIIVASNLDYFGSLDNGKLSLYIDGNKQQVSIKKTNDLNWFDFGEIILKPGEHEITIPISNDNNIITKPSQIKNVEGSVEVVSENNFRMNSSIEDSWLKYTLSDYNPQEKYLVRFYHKVIKGFAPVVDILQEKDDFTSPYNDKKIKTKDVAQLDSYDFDWRYFETSFGNEGDATMKLARSTTQPTVRISIPVWNDCEFNNLKDQKLCTNKEFRKKYDRPSVVEFRDLKITKLLNSQMFLRSSQNLTQIEEPKLKYKKISPVEYQVNVDSKEPSFVMVFNESFHPGWKVELSDGKQTKLIDEKNHYMANGYANGWLIDQSGKLTLKIKFMPQEYLNTGIIMSITGCLVFISLIFWKRFIVRKQNG